MIGWRHILVLSPVSFDKAGGAAAAGADAVSSLLHNLRPDMLRFAMWLARDRTVAEDVVQEAMLRAWRSREELKDAAAARPWLLTIVRREHARLYERKRLELTNLHDAIEREDGLLAAEDDTELEALRIAIFSLSDEYREPLVLQVLGGFSTGEIAAQLGLTPPAVRTRLFRARNQLRVVYGMAAAPDGAIDENDQEMSR
jgi:RNA polymerase sigma-70 factor (ECF subfamily)